MKALRFSLYALAATLLAVLALALVLWAWSARANSLATSLDQLARYLPAGQTLEAKDVNGSLRGGGRIGWLRWQRAELSVELREMTIAWSLRPLLGGELRLGQVAARHLRIEDRRAPSKPTPPTNLRLPLKVDVPFTVDTVEWIGAQSLQATGLAGHYVFDGQSHRLDGGQVHISSGQYRIRGSVQASSPLALTLQVDGTVLTALPSSEKLLRVNARATVTGALAGLDAALALQAELAPELKPAPGSEPTLQARVSARLQPWQAQPVAQAQASWQALNLAALWPQAPRTRLSGEATVTPQGAGWLANIELSNALIGPWDQQRLPLQGLDAQVDYVAGQWRIKALQARVAGGRIEGTGQFAPNPTAGNTAAAWQGQATLSGINMAALDSRLAAVTLDGQLTAQQVPAGIAFEARLLPAKGQTPAPKSKATARNTLAGLRVKTVNAQGLWDAPTLQLSTLAVQTDDARLQGELTFHTASRATAGDLTLTWPGAKATLAGHLADTRGQGEMNLQISNAALASRWLARLPGAPAALGQTSIEGNAEFTGRWQGGWQQQGQTLQVQASVRAPRLDLRQAGQPAQQAWQVRDWQAELSGSLRALSLSTQAQADKGTHRLKLQAKAQGRRMGEGRWQAQFDNAELTAQDSLNPGLWTLQLSEAVTVNWTQRDTTRTLESSAGAARLSGPVPGVARLNWQGANWSQQMTGASARSQWRSQGRLADLPLAWLDLIGQTQMANLGLRGDLVLGGQWDAASAETLRVRATLERTRGDLQIQVPGGENALVQAGVREARLTVTSEGERLATSLRWDSERAGQAQADFSTRLQRQGDSWSWPQDAALAGTLKIKLPPVGAWSLLAPPGWRLRGTLDADAVLSGTRGAPQWRGHLGAQDLALRSVVDGIDFSQGTLRASLDGQRLQIQTFTLQGAGGANGGLLSIEGSVLWLPATEPDAKNNKNVVQRLRMELDATLDALRLSARADRLLVLSGKLSARLNDAKLAIRGTLKADQALFILPADTAPRLGGDVLVRTPSHESVRAAPAPAPAEAGTRVTPDVAITVDFGQDFQVRGRGLATRLAGSLELRSAGRSPSLTGSLRTVRGTYRAYGQQLAVEQGVLRFYGPYDNPALDILAIRPNLQQRVGVQISGTALSPLVRLFAEPDLPEAEKLAWLVLGRSGASGGAETAMLQQAALALLGGNNKGISSGLTAALRLDQLSVSASNIDGATSATVTLGKRLSRDFYVIYERSLAGTLGTMFIFYDLSRRFTLRAQAGEQNAVDLIFTLRYD